MDDSKNSIILNFTDKSTGDTLLNFGGNADYVNAYSSVALFSEIVAIYHDDKIDVNVAFSSDINAVFIENECHIDTQISLANISNITAIFDINHIVGLYGHILAEYQQANSRLCADDIIFNRTSVLRQNTTVDFERGLTLSNGAFARFERTQNLHRSVKIECEKALGKSETWRIVWQENGKAFIQRALNFDVGESLRLKATVRWQEMIRHRRLLTCDYQVAEVFAKIFTLPWDDALEIKISRGICWEKAKPTYYRKHPVEPWIPPPPKPYQGKTDLNFICSCTEVDSHNVVLNFGVDDCIPRAFTTKTWWYIVNKISITRLDNGEKINVLSGDYSTDREAWCWTYRLVVPATELAKLQPIDGKPVILQLDINGFVHLMLLENRQRSRQFAKDTYTLSGRSVSALLDSPSSPARAFLQENERTSVQLVQAEIDRSAYPDLTLNWRLIDELGWIIPAESFSYSGLTPIAAIKDIAEAAGGFVYSEANSQAITIKPLYKKTFWDGLNVDDYDILLPQSIVTDISTDYVTYPDYNGITLTNDKTGLTGQIKRRGTAADVLCETVNNPLFTNELVLGSYGKAALAKAGLVENHSFTLPLTAEIGQCKPADILAFDGQWWGIVDSVGVSFSHGKVTQQITVERVNHG